MFKKEFLTKSLNYSNDKPIDNLFGKVINFETIAKLNISGGTRRQIQSKQQLLCNKEIQCKHFQKINKENVTQIDGIKKLEIPLNFKRELDFSYIDKIFDKFLKSSIEFQKKKKKLNIDLDKIICRSKFLIPPEKKTNEHIRKTIKMPCPKFIVQYPNLGKKTKRTSKIKDPSDDWDEEHNNNSSLGQRQITITDNEENIY